MIKTLINPELIDLSLSAKTKEGAFHEMAMLLKRHRIIDDYIEFIDDIMEREMLGTTGFGFGIAIPHAKSKHVLKPAIVFGRSEKGVTYDSIDGNPVHLIFMIAMPDTSAKHHLVALAWLSRNLIHASFRNALLEAKTKEEVMHIMKQADGDNF